MKPMDNLEQAIANLPLQPRGGLEQRIVDDASKASAETEETLSGDERETLNIRSRAMRNKWLRYAVAAAIAVAVLSVLRGILPGKHESGIAFAQVVQNVLAAKNVTYTQVVEMAGKPALTFQEMRMEPGLSRTYYTHDGSFPVIQITDCRLARQIQILPDTRKAYVTRYVNAPQVAPRPTNPFESMLQIGQTQGEFIGEKMMGDRFVRGFRVKQNMQQAEIWADAQTGLPVLVEITQAGGSSGDYRQDASKWTFRDFTWNQDLDRQLFSVQPPSGYAVEESDLDMAPASEKDLVEALRLWTDAADGVFPQALDRQSIPTPGVEMKEGVGSSVSLGGGESVSVMSSTMSTAQGGGPSDLEAVMDNRLKMMRGLDFAHSVRKLNWQYLGGGVKRGQGDRPVCWWQPKDSETYRVIYGNLSVRDVAASNLPREAAATDPEP